MPPSCDAKSLDYIRVARSGEMSGTDNDLPILIPPLTKEWREAERAAEALRNSGYDFNAWREQRAFDQKCAEEELKDESSRTDS
jgi:hypothetical protein